MSMRRKFTTVEVTVSPPVRVPPPAPGTRPVEVVLQTLDVQEMVVRMGDVKVSVKLVKNGAFASALEFRVLNPDAAKSVAVCSDTLSGTYLRVGM